MSPSPYWTLRSASRSSSSWAASSGSTTWGSSTSPTTCRRCATSPSASSSCTAGPWSSRERPTSWSRTPSTPTPGRSLPPSPTRTRRTRAGSRTCRRASRPASCIPRPDAASIPAASRPSPGAATRRRRGSAVVAGPDLGAGVVVCQDLLGPPSLLRHAGGAELRHSHPVAKSRSEEEKRAGAPVRTPHRLHLEGVGLEAPQGAADGIAPHLVPALASHHRDAPHVPPEPARARDDGVDLPHGPAEPPRDLVRLHQPHPAERAQHGLPGTAGVDVRDPF